MNAAFLTPHAGITSGSDPDAAPARLCVTGWQAAPATLPAAWDALAVRAGTPNPFHESWYLGPALRRFDPHGRVLLARLETDGRLLGLLPLFRTARYGRRPVPHLAAWLHANCFLGAPLVEAGQEAAFWTALLDWADAHAGAALFLHLAAMPLDAPLTAALETVCAAQGRRFALVQREERAMLASDLAPDAYLARALSGKKRKEYRRQHARLAERGALATVRHDDGADLDGWIEDFLDLEASGWKGRAGSALASAPETAGLFREAMHEAGRRGQLERLALELDGRRVAMLASFLSPPGAFSFKTAFDETMARFSPGVLLQLENLALLDHPHVRWCDSCAAANHPMIDSLWTERRPVGRLSVAIGGRLRRAAFDRLLAMELSRNPTGIA